MKYVLLAMDRAPSALRVDAQGFLHLSASNISKANVCPYYGREIPGWRELGLDENRVYKLLRDPAELAKAAHTFDNLPILSEHIPVDADSIPDDLVVGSTGSHATFANDYLANSLALWKRSAIEGVESNRKRELSSAYRYTPDMTPGNYKGVAYDGKMCNIIGNHVALVIEGRAGPDVLVGDENTMKTKTALLVTGALTGLVRPLLAQDAKLDLTGPLADVSAGSLGDGKTVAEAVHALATPLLAADKALTVEEIQAAIMTVPTIALAEDALTVTAAPAKVVDKDGKTTNVTNVIGMDEAAVATRIETAVQAERVAMTAIRAAEQDVFPHIGRVTAMDSAAAYYEMALDGANVKHDGVTDIVALKAMVAMLPDPNGKPVTYTVIAQDAAANSKFDTLFPDAKPLVRS